jgi:TrmH family RNA methyltransferase
MITSVQNPKIKWIRSLQGESKARREAGAFVVEGVRLVEESYLAGWDTKLVVYAEGLGERSLALLEAFRDRGAAVEQVAPHVLGAASDTQTPQGILAVVSMRALPILDRLDFAFIPDGIRDPGNLGTMLRTAAAAGVQVVLLPPETTDPFAPKVMRAGMGAHFRLPILSLDWDAIREILAQSDLQVYLAEAASGLAYTQVDLRRPLALIVGGEAEGAGPQAQSLAQARVYIPMPGGGESLNVAVAAGIILFEAARQRQ